MWRTIWVLLWLNIHGLFLLMLRLFHFVKWHEPDSAVTKIKSKISEQKKSHFSCETLKMVEQKKFYFYTFSKCINKIPHRNINHMEKFDGQKKNRLIECKDQNSIAIVCSTVENRPRWHHSKYDVWQFFESKSLMQ